MLFIKSKIQFFESKSQLKHYIFELFYSCLSSQRYNFLKANHNRKSEVPIPTVLFIKSKIQFFESKSQHEIVDNNENSSCLSSQRYNFLKANHNKYLQAHYTIQLFIKSKIQFFESKSQQNEISEINI